MWNVGNAFVFSFKHSFDSYLSLPYYFILFFSHVSAAEAEEMAEKMRAHIRQDACGLRSVLSIPGESLLAWLSACKI